MGALTRFALLGALNLATPLEARPVDRWQSIIERASIRFGIPARWIEQVIDAESHGLTEVDGHPIRSKAGAIGLMQLMPATWASLRARFHLGDNPDDPADNIFAGTAFLRLMYDRFGYPGLFAAYNAGPGRYARAAAGRTLLPVETQTYLARITGGINAPVLQAPARLFAVRYQAAGQAGEPTPRSSLFALRYIAP